MIERTRERNSKKIIATSKAEYRNVTIYTTDIGFTFIWNGLQFNCQTLSEATAAIDAIYVKVAELVLTKGKGK